MLRGFVFALLSTGCAAAVDSGRVSAEVSETLRSFESRLNSGEYEAALAHYADDPRFVAYEDGETRYRSFADVAAAYEQLPSYGRGQFRYDDVEVVVLDGDHAHVAASFWTAFGEPGSPRYFQFEGKLTLVMERFKAGWKMLTLHSSTAKPRR